VAHFAPEPWVLALAASSPPAPRPPPNR
jgi:hypothetical protein